MNEALLFCILAYFSNEMLKNIELCKNIKLCGIQSAYLALDSDPKFGATFLFWFGGTFNYLKCAISAISDLNSHNTMDFPELL